MGTGTALQRRLVERYAVEQFDLGWNVRHVRPRVGRRRRTLAERGQVLDVSVAGAAVRAPADPLLRPRRPVVIEVEGQLGAVVIRNVRPTEDPATVVYGVEFVELSDAARSQLLDPIESDRRHVPHWEWTGEAPPA